jgi:hypothetical protein
VYAFQRKGSRVIARPQACVTDGHKHQEQRDNSHSLKPSWLPNDPDQWLAASGLSTPLGFIASPLHRVVQVSRSAAG